MPQHHSSRTAMSNRYTSSDFLHPILVQPRATFTFTHVSALTYFSLDEFGDKVSVARPAERVVPICDASRVWSAYESPPPCLPVCLPVRLPCLSPSPPGGHTFPARRQLTSGDDTHVDAFRCHVSQPAIPPTHPYCACAACQMPRGHVWRSRSPSLGRRRHCVCIL